MKIIVLYGSGEVSKRSYLLKIKSSFDKDSITEIDLKKDPISKLYDSLAAVPLFIQDKKLVIIENMPDSFNLKDLKMQDDTLTAVITRNNLTATSILLKSAKEVKSLIYPFEGEKELSAFGYLDNLIEGNKQAFLELNKLLEEYGGMYVITMVYYLLRRNLLPPPQSSFMRGKIIGQKQAYVFDDWPKLYQIALLAEFNIKTGVTDEKTALYALTQRVVTRDF